MLGRHRVVRSATLPFGAPRHGSAGAAGHRAVERTVRTHVDVGRRQHLLMRRSQEAWQRHHVERAHVVVRLGLQRRRGSSPTGTPSSRSSSHVPPANCCGFSRGQAMQCLKDHVAAPRQPPPPIVQNSPAPPVTGAPAAPASSVGQLLGIDQLLQTVLLLLELAISKARKLVNTYSKKKMLILLMRNEFCIIILAILNCIHNYFVRCRLSIIDLGYINIIP